MKPALRIQTHWQVAQSGRTSQNLPKSMAAPTLAEKKMKKHGHTTHGIVYAGFRGFRRFVARKNARCNLIGNCFVIPHDTIPSNDIHKGFMFCLLSSKRPFHEILKPGDVNQMAVMESQFSGMTDEDFSYNTYENVKRKLLKKVIAHLSEHDKALLTSFTSGDPVWPEKDLSCFPGIRWKLLNIRKLKTSNKIKYQHQLDQLAQILDYTGKQ